MRQWHDLLRHILRAGTRRQDRTGVGTLSIFGATLVVGNHHDFPAVTTKKLAVKQCFSEMACFIRGYEDLSDFNKMGCHIWDDNARAWDVDSADPWLGRIYGVQWRYWNDAHGRSHDQLLNLVRGLKSDPYGRRHIVTAWNPGELDQMCLPPCPCFYQCYVHEGYLDMQVYQRSCDTFIGLPFDLAGYALLQRLIAKETGLISRRLLFVLGDAHIYLNHLSQVAEVLDREPFKAPDLELTGDLFTFLPDQARLLDYLHHGFVAAKLNV